MDKIEKIRQEIKQLRKLLEDHNYYLDNSEQALGYGLALDDIEKFLDTLSEEPDTPEFPETFEICLYDGRTPDKESCTKCSTTCSVRKEEPDKSLEGAAEKYRKESFKKSVMPQIDGPVSEYGGSIKDAFIAGWKCRDDQMLKDSVEGYINYYEDSGGILMAEAQVGCPYHVGDKVRIVVLKAEEE